MRLAIRPLIFSSQIHNQPTFPPLQQLSSDLQHYINSTTPKHGQKIHTHIIKTGFLPNTNISIKLLILHLKSGCLSYSQQVFDELPQRTLSAYNYLISGYLKAGKVEQMVCLVRKLVSDGEWPDGFTFSMILKACTSVSNAMFLKDLERVVHGLIVKSLVEPDDVLYTALVDAYVKSRNVGYGRRVFEMMMEQNVICSTSMISGYMNQGNTEEAEHVFWKTNVKDIVVYNAMIEGYSKKAETALKGLQLYVDMQRANFQPNISTFASVIGACSILGDFVFGQQVQTQLLKTEFYANIKMGSALLDMYAKCGNTDDARRIFNFMSEKNVFTWTSMIDGYGKNGHPVEALDLFRNMQSSHVEPNYVTFLGALSACGHAGLVNEGRGIFESMERDYSMKPRMEHYACMVDMLGRVGRLNEAWDFIMKMDEKPSSDVWAALVSCCNVHGDVEMARIAANELFKLGRDCRPGAYVSLSNTFAAAENWDSVSELRETMKVKGILKNTACSAIG
ncbi:hypothetical protein ACFE04_014859 [Oxalis oulophora]